MFNVGEAVVCVDASDIPTPPWKPLTCGASYVVRDVESVPSVDGVYDKNIYKNSHYLVRLWGITNSVNPAFGKELGYADGRFEKIEPDTVKKTEKLSIKSFST